MDFYSNNRDTVFIDGVSLSDVVIVTNETGASAVKHSSYLNYELKYNRLLSNQLVDNVNKNIISVDDVELKNVVINADAEGNNVIIKDSDSDDEPISEEEIFNYMLKQMQEKANKSQKEVKDYVSSKPKIINENLQLATEYYRNERYTKASEAFRNALTIIQTDKYPDEFRLNTFDLLSIKYALALSELAVNKYCSMKVAFEILNSLISEYGSKFPSLYYTLARFYFQICNYEKAKKALETGFNILNNCENLSELMWPGTNLVISDTEKSSLKENMIILQDDCNSPLEPDAKCCSETCTADNVFLYFNSPNFLGYTNVKCTENCSLAYHPICWKMKLKSYCTKNISNCLNKPCDTNACTGLKSEITIYNEYLKIITSKVFPREIKTNDKLKKEKTVKITKKQDESEMFKPPERQVGKKPKTETQELKHNKSVLKPDALEFTPGKNIKSGTEMQKKSEIKTPKLVPTNLNVSIPEFVPSKMVVEVKDKIPNEIQTTLNVEVPEFLPKTYAEVSSKVSDWSDNIENSIFLYNNSTDLYASSSYSSTWNNLVPLLQSPVLSEGINRRSRSNTITITPETKCKGLQTDPVECHCTSTQCQVLVSEQATQSNFDNFDNQLLQTETSILKSELQQTEDAYNSLLFKYKALEEENAKRTCMSNRCLQTCDVSSQTDVNFKENLTVVLENVRKQNEINTASFNSRIQQLQKKNDQLNAKVGDLNVALAQEKERNKNYIQQLKKTNQDLIAEVDETKKLLAAEKEKNTNSVEKLNDHIGTLINDKLKLERNIITLQEERTEYKTNMLPIHKICLENIQYFRNFCISYFTGFENKCKCILWEFENLKQIMPTPSVFEFQESCQSWNAALIETIKTHSEVKNYFDQLLKCLAGNKLSDIPVLNFLRAPNISEPAIPFLNQLKVVILLNKKYEEDLSKMMLAIYQQQFNQQKTAQLSQIDSSNSFNVNPITNENPYVFPQIEDNNVNIPLTSSTPETADRQLQENKETLSSVASASVPQNAYQPSESFFSGFETLTKGGAKPRRLINMNASASEALGFAGLTKNESEDKSLVTINGIDGLVQKLQKLFPETSPQVLSEVLQELRQQCGGLSGMSNKDIHQQVKKMIKEKSSKTTTQSKSLPKRTEPVWKQVNKNFQWSNKEPEKNCTICFEPMSRCTTIQLRCQHIFHVHCIKTWLQNDSICPICRSFTTLDDEFPPLN